jgi:hypothetical protein
MVGRFGRIPGAFNADHRAQVDTDARVHISVVPRPASPFGHTPPPINRQNLPGHEG